MVWPNILNGDDMPLCLHLQEYKDTTGNDLFFKAKPKTVFSGSEKFHIYSRRGGNMNSGFHFLLIRLLHDSLSDEIGYKTVTFAGYEHSFQAPYRPPGGGGAEAGKSLTLISALLHRHPEIDLLITGKACFLIF